jgi:hypothetical protein
LRRFRDLFAHQMSYSAPEVAMDPPSRKIQQQQRSTIVYEDVQRIIGRQHLQSTVSHMTDLRGVIRRIKNKIFSSNILILLLFIFFLFSLRTDEKQ